MEHNLCYDMSNGDDHPNGWTSGWRTIPYDLWSDGHDFGGCSATFSSPTTISIPSSSRSTEPDCSAFKNIRSSSIVSAAISNWSETLATPPVTPQSAKWCTPTSFELFAKPPPRLSFCALTTTHDSHIEENSQWEVKTQLPLLPTQYPQTPDPSCSSGYTGDDNPLSQFPSAAYDPSLSRQIFTDPTYGSSYQMGDVYHVDWSNGNIWSTPQTVEPRETMQTMLSSSPISKLEGSSPIKAERAKYLEIGLDSSPLPAPSPRVVPSQHCVDSFEIPHNTPALVIQPTLTRRLCHRGLRRPYGRKSLASMASKPRVSTESVACDVVIPHNTFGCTIPGCIDKNTGKPKRFRRQEHRKRHEQTVHKGEKKYICWVPGCSTSFNRTDNLKNHIQKTHGKNSPAQRNRYVATLDVSSEYYDPQWQGGLTDDGFPLIKSISLQSCSILGCEKIYHLREKLRTHLLQQHGKKSSDSDNVYVAQFDENSDCFDPDWEDKAFTENVSI